MISAEVKKKKKKDPISLSVPHEQPCSVESQIQAPNHIKSMWQNSRTAVDVTVRISEERKSGKSLCQNTRHHTGHNDL